MALFVPLWDSLLLGNKRLVFYPFFCVITKKTFGNDSITKHLYKFDHIGGNHG